MPIESFKHKGLEELFVEGKSAKIGQNMKKTALFILDHLDAITDLKDCKGVRNFHPLKGNRKGEYAMDVTGNYRITFEWESPDVKEVDLEDYH